MKPAGRTDPAVDAFMRDLDHPLKKELETVRGIILAVSPEITETIKWKAPTFRAKDDFATMNLRSLDRVQLIFHTGVKVKENAKTGIKIEDPAGLTKWIAKDRCMVTLGAGKDIPTKRAAFQTFVRDWIALL